MSSKNQIVIQSEGIGTLRLGPRHGEYLDLEAGIVINWNPPEPA